MSQQAEANYAEPSYFSGTERLVSQINELRNDFFTRPMGTYSESFVSANGLMARDELAEQLEGSRVHVEYGVLTGLCTLELTNTNIMLGVGTHLKNSFNLHGEEATLSQKFLAFHMHSARSSTDIDSRFIDEFEPVVDSLAKIYDFDGDCEATIIARNSVRKGFIYGLNTVISMCDDWDEWTQNMHQKIQKEH